MTDKPKPVAMIRQGMSYAPIYNHVQEQSQRAAQERELRNNIEHNGELRRMLRADPDLSKMEKAEPGEVSTSQRSYVSAIIEHHFKK